MYYKDFSSPIGTIIAGSTDKGISFLYFKDRIDMDSLIENLMKQFKKKIVEGTNNLLDQLETELKEYFDQERHNFSLPIDINGTEFQKTVWKELLLIPYGQTRTYKQLAEKLDKPDAMRAVGNANGKNPLSIVIPCHRVVHKDGKRMGYGGGIERKKFLLELEQKQAKQKSLEQYIKAF